jgi:hypothetical protein
MNRRSLRAAESEMNRVGGRRANAADGRELD